MLKKLLKYDLKFIFKYWWLGAVICILFSIVGGFGMSLIDVSFFERELPEVVESSAVSMIFLAVIAFSGFSIVSLILIFARYQSNLFSDEGYLTFTLPVKRTTLINSKVISATITELATIMVLFLGVILALIVTYWDTFWSNEFWKELFDSFIEFFEGNVITGIIVVLEAIIITVLSCMVSVLFLYACITFACAITRKARVITAIGIYYGVSLVISLILQILVPFSAKSLDEYFKDLSQSMENIVVCLSGLAVILFICTLCVILYAFIYRTIDRKLNLA